MIGVPSVGDNQIWQAHYSMMWSMDILVQMETMGQYPFLEGGRARSGLDDGVGFDVLIHMMYFL